MTAKIPFLKPSPPKLSQLVEELQKIENSGVYSNFGPVNAEFENTLIEQLFGGSGNCLTVCNATIGLMIAIKFATKNNLNPNAKYALMPSFTFAATAQAAMWAGLTPLFCDVDPLTWMPSHSSEISLLKKYGSSIAVVVPYATFGNCLDVGHYNYISQKYKVPIVVDAAASLGSESVSGLNFGHDSSHTTIFSMHATKTFSTGEAGVIYSRDAEIIKELRLMSNFGFSIPRTATDWGLNSKLSEVGALLALAKLRDFKAIVEHRAGLAAIYRNHLPGWQFQELVGHLHAYRFMPVLPPKSSKFSRESIVTAMEKQGVSVAAYFSPHLAHHPFFKDCPKAQTLAYSDQISQTILSLPLWDGMSIEDVEYVCKCLNQAIERA